MSQRRQRMTWLFWPGPVTSVTCQSHLSSTGFGSRLTTSSLEMLLEYKFPVLFTSNLLKYSLQIPFLIFHLWLLVTNSAVSEALSLRSLIMGAHWSENTIFINVLWAEFEFHTFRDVWLLNVTYHSSTKWRKAFVVGWGFAAKKRWTGKCNTEF